MHLNRLDSHTSSAAGDPSRFIEPTTFSQTLIPSLFSIFPNTPFSFFLHIPPKRHHPITTTTTTTNLVVSSPLSCSRHSLPPSQISSAICEQAQSNPKQLESKQLRFGVRAWNCVIWVSIRLGGSCGI
ncbi:hypothetical protein Droror1_Dr00012624 [Drosera rotundifolia]